MNAAVSVIDAVNRLASIDVPIVRWLPLVLVHLKTSSLAPRCVTGRNGNR